MNNDFHDFYNSLNDESSKHAALLQALKACEEYFSEDSAEKEIKRLSEELKEVKKQLNNQKFEIVALKSEQNKKEKTIRDLESRLEAAKSLTEEKSYSISEMQAIIANLERDNDGLKHRLETAKTRFAEMQDAMETARDSIHQDIYDSLQIVRDRVCDIGDTVQVASKERGKPVVEYNNILSFLEIIIDQLTEQHLWSEKDDMPNLTRVSPVKSKKASSKVSTSSESCFGELVEQQLEIG